MVFMRVADDVSSQSLFALVDDAGIPMGVVSAAVARDLISSARVTGAWRIPVEVIENAIRHASAKRPRSSHLFAAGPLPMSHLRKLEPRLGYARGA